MSFSPKDIGAEIKKYIPEFKYRINLITARQ
jgi:hypothetical protein